ncbi:hypothetical protein [Tropicimonas sp. IMCC34011]|uniref:hypothetical protein n=1 Tax=Tropicimonas sp. IMCC34011 TaxID=2248759 RepID=UPI000E2437FF|nr:hypothetical protein [Tropicimonas sp. IMCC34011]
MHSVFFQDQQAVANQDIARRITKATLARTLTLACEEAALGPASRHRGGIINAGHSIETALSSADDGPVAAVRVTDAVGGHDAALLILRNPPAERFCHLQQCYESVLVEQGKQWTNRETMPAR